jgi:hypothetical protein
MFGVAIGPLKRFGPTVVGSDVAHEFTSEILNRSEHPLERLHLVQSLGLDWNVEPIVASYGPHVHLNQVAWVTPS